jgi:PAS domain S-box-containing protein
MQTGSSGWLAETLAVFARTDTRGEPLTTREVTEQLDCTRRATYDRLQRLADRGTLHTKKVGARGRIWWRAPSDDAGLFTVDEQYRLVSVDDRAADLFEARDGGLVGEPLWEVLTAFDECDVREHLDRAFDRQEPTDYEDYVESRQRWVNLTISPSETGLSVSVRDVTARRARERELERYEAAVETIGDGVYIVDDESRFLLVNDAHTHLTGYAREELLGAHASLVTTDEALALAERQRDDLELAGEGVTTIETELVTKDGERRPIETRFALFPLGAGRTGRVGVVRDITERRERERERQQYETIVETIDDGVYVLDGDYHFTAVNDAYLEMMGYDREELLGAHCSLVVGEDVSSAAVEQSRALVGTDGHATLEAEIERADGSRFFAESKFTPLPVDEGRDGASDAGERSGGTVGVVRDTTARRRREQELARQREQLAALNDLQSVISGLTEAVIAQSTREEIERVVCDRLADAETYQCAWVGEIDRSLGAVRVKATSGCGATEGTEVPIGADATSGDGEMVDAAVRTGAVQVRRRSDGSDWPADDRADGDAPEEPSASASPALEAELHSAAAIPIVHDGVVFGVVVMSTARPDAFEDDEQATIDHLGEIVGHAIASIDRKRALMSDEVVELRFQMSDVSTALGIAGEMDGTVSIARTVPVDDGRYLAYGTVTADAVETLEAIVENDAHWEELTFRDHGDAERGFEVVVTEPPVTSAVAAQGGEVVEARIVDGTLNLGVHLPPGADVRALSDVVEATYPGVEMVTRRQVSRAAPRRESLLETALTDRQRAALEASYQAGFFEWPRVTSGEEVAATLGISPSTFHEHLRTAERKLVASFLE